ncbi:hypothetical protein CKF54_01635 [Psittacicella hinzii]|uniref:Uncharacterized protein n=1 Tax=Psittacicella hinzii TaxID=2028575 RepID=A0A3A1YA95_9GAMM|nr:hypothetical protein [Psittacicella hinzii]RIY34159.1 hypothetical protein CKF54_01635 [Psittacicella hinzii]
MSKSALCTKVADFVKSNKQLLLGFSLFSLAFFKLYIVVLFLPIVYFHLLNTLNPQYNPSTNEHREYYWSFLVLTIIQLLLLVVGISLAVFLFHIAGFLGLVVGLIIGYITSYVFVLLHSAYSYLFLNDVTIVQAVTEGHNLYNKLPAKQRKSLLTFFSLSLFVLGGLSLFCYNSLFVFLAAFLVFVLTITTSYLSTQDTFEENEEESESACHKCNLRSFNYSDLLDPQTYVKFFVWLVKIIFDTIAGVFQVVYAVFADIRQAFLYSDDSSNETSSASQENVTPEIKQEESTAEEKENSPEEDATTAQEVTSQTENKADNSEQEENKSTEDSSEKEDTENNKNSEDKVDNLENPIRLDLNKDDNK